MKKSKLLKIFGTYNKKQWKRIVSVVKKNTADKNSSVRRTKENRLTLISNCFNYGKSRLIKNRERSSRFSRLGINIPIYRKKIT